MADAVVARDRCEYCRARYQPTADVRCYNCGAPREDLVDTRRPSREPPSRGKMNVLTCRPVFVGPATSNTVHLVPVCHELLVGVEIFAPADFEIVSIVAGVILIVDGPLRVGDAFTRVVLEEVERHRVVLSPWTGLRVTMINPAKVARSVRVTALTVRQEEETRLTNEALRRRAERDPYYGFR